MEMISWLYDDTPFSPGQTSSCNYVNDSGGDWEFTLVRRVERGITGPAAVQGAVNASFVGMHISMRMTYHERDTLRYSALSDA